MYYYEDYSLKETPNAFEITELLGESKVRIEKSVVKKFEKSNRETEMIAILLGKVELIRIDSAKASGRGPRSFLKEERFQQKLEVLLSTTYIENILEEISQMKFFEMKEYFLQEDSSEVDEE